MGNEFDLASQLKQIGMTYGQIVEARNGIYDRVEPWAKEKWPKISTEVIEKNLVLLDKIMQLEKTCSYCMSIDQCPDEAGAVMRGRLDGTGYVSIWFEPCPKRYKHPKREGASEEKRWQKKS